MTYTWDYNLETGNEQIDSQHKQLIETLNKLITAHKEARGATELGKTFEFLENYILQHFKYEEQLQIDYKYPGYEQHKQEHNDFKFVIKNLTDQLAEEGYTPQLVEKTINTMTTWFFPHIKNHDLKLANHIHEIKEGKAKDMKHI